MRTTREESAAEIVQGLPSCRWPDGALRCAVFLTLIAVPLAIWGGVIDYNLGKAAIQTVDSENRTGATGLYDSVGMHPVRIRHTYVKELRSGLSLVAQ